MINLSKKLYQQSNLKKIIHYFIVIVSIFVFSSCFPGGWSPDSKVTYLKSIVNEVQLYKPIIANLFLILLNYIFQSFNFFIHFHIQIILYIIAIFKISKLFSYNKSLLILIFFLSFPPFLGTILTFWTISTSLPFLLFAIYFLLLKIYKKKENNLMFYFNLIIFSFFRWENVIISGLLLFLYFLKQKNFMPKFFEKKKIFIKFIFAFLITLIFFKFNIFIHQELNEKNFLTVQNKQDKQNLFVSPRLLLHLSGKLEKDLIPSKFLKRNISELSEEKRIQKYKDYYNNYRIHKIRKFFKSNILLTKEFNIFYLNIKKQYSKEINFIIRRLQFSNFSNKAKVLYPSISYLNEGIFKNSKFKDNNKFELVENMYVKKKVNKYLKSYKKSIFNYISIYYFCSFFIFVFFFIQSLKITNDSFLKYKYFILSLLSSCVFLQVNIFLLFLSVHVIEFRLLITGLICLFSSLLLIQKKN